MKTALAALFLALVAGCGGGGSGDKPPVDDGIGESMAADAASASASAAADPHNQACNRLGRTWAVQAEKLVTKLYVALPVTQVTDAMTSATDQMDIEGCTGEVVDLALDGNYRAVLASTKLITCSSDDPFVCGEQAGDLWKKQGFPLLAKVRALVG